MLHIMISPAKKMNMADDHLAETGTPVFLKETQRLMEYLQGLGREELQAVWKCNDKITDLNMDRLKTMDLRGRTAPAVMAYEGIQYQSMAPWVMDKSQLEYIGTHLYILSGFYGILKAFDGVTPYRLEMQAKIALEYEGKTVNSLYNYWGNRLYTILAQGADTIINLASEEYSKAVKPWRQPKVRVIDCVFGELEDKDGRQRVRVKATEAKMARGSMVRYMAEHQVEDPEQMKAFDVMGYRYEEGLSSGDRMVFVKK